MPGWVVVKFIDENSVEVVPYKWVTKDDNHERCWWPNYKKKNQIVDAILNKTCPCKDWKIHEIEPCSSKIYTNFDEVNKKASRARYDLSATEDFTQKRLTKKPARFISSPSSSPVNDYPNPPVATVGIEKSKLPSSMVEKSFQNLIEINDDTPIVIGDYSNFDNETAPPPLEIIDVHSVRGSFSHPQQFSRHLNKINSNEASNEALENQPTITTNQSQEDFQKQCLRELAILNVRIRDLTDFMHAHIGFMNRHDDNPQEKVDTFKGILGLLLHWPKFIGSGLTACVG